MDRNRFNLNFHPYFPSPNHQTSNAENSQSSNFQNQVPYFPSQQFPNSSPYFPMPQSGYVGSPFFQFQNQSEGLSGNFGGSPDATLQSPASLAPNSAFSENSEYQIPHDLNGDMNEVEDGKHDKVPWKPEEDKLLISAWLNVSKDAQVGTDQKGDTFWKRIYDYCEESQPGLIKRSLKAIPKRWSRISQAVNQFGASYDKANRTIGSGSNNENVMELANKLYYDKVGKKCSFVSHWQELRKEPKWRSIHSECGGSKRTKIAASGNYSSSCSDKETHTEMADEVDIGCTPRPEGTKSSKRKGKGKSNAIENMEALNLAHSKKLDMMSQIKEVLARDAASREIIAAAKKKDVEIKEREQIMEILYKDTSNMSPSQLEFHARLLDEVKANHFK